MTAKRAADHYRAGNLEVATVVLADPERYGGETAGLVQWARLFISRVEAPPADWEAGPLFRQAA
jgi:hypothetical protein